MIINGREISEEIQIIIKKKIDKIKKRKPGLALIIIGKNQASISYVRMKKKMCEKIGIISEIITLPENTTEKNLIIEIEKLNNADHIDGILVQLPLPSFMNVNRILLTIDPDKDVDGFHPINLGKLLLGNTTGFIPCTPLGIHILLNKSLINIKGKHVVIVGRSNIVGKPLASLLVQKRKGCNATVTVAHSASKNLSDITRSADVLISAIGIPLFITAEMVKEKSVVIDVGINRLDNKIVGDVDFEAVSKKVSHITPVPGGVGPMTIISLMHNTLKSYFAKFPSEENSIDEEELFLNL
jgi:methylenetetrahydrofolate dehydrogenase (NADP+)/methenyltetrahydrofolate cyclohydrolase